MLGLTLGWMGALVIICLQNGAVKEADVPSPLFAFGGVFGMQRSTIEVAWRTTCAGLVGVAVLGICDFLYASRTRSRWFGLHAIANGWISLLCLPDLWFILSDPLTALTQTEVNH